MCYVYTLFNIIPCLQSNYSSKVNVFSQVSSPGKALNLYPSNEYEVLPSGSEAHWEVVERILFIYAKLNPGIAYVQGMNEIVGPIYYTFATDPNSQWKGRSHSNKICERFTRGQ